MTVLLSKGYAPVVLLLLTATVVRASNVAVLIPAYYDMTSNSADYDTLKTSAATLGSRLLIIINISNGPLSSSANSQYSAYTSFISSVRSSGSKVLGYVYTQQGNRAIATVNADVDTWYDYYTLDGIFYDEGSVSSSMYNQYNNYQAYAKTKASAAGQSVPIIVFNPGYATDTEGESYASISDIMVIMENYESNFAGWTGWAWMPNHANTNFALLGHSCDTWQCIISKGQNHNAYYVFATDYNNNGNPWAGLPSYWSEFVSAVAAGTAYSVECAGSNVHPASFMMAAGVAAIVMLLG